MQTNIGDKRCFNEAGKFISGLNKGDKIGVLVDMFEGSIKFYINNEDKGWAYQNE